MNVRKTVGITTKIEGFHAFAKAEEVFGKDVDFLATRHRHMFGIELEMLVFHNERDQEFILLKRQVENYIQANYGKPAEFGNMSCESIAQELMENFTNVVMVKVDEDGENYARILIEK